MRRFVWFGPAAAVCLAAACRSGLAAPPYKPMADTKTLMQAMVDPSAVQIWNSVKYIETAAGEEKIVPTTDAEWLVLRNAAIIVTESGNLIMMPGRAKEGTEWNRVTLAMMGKANELREAAEAHDVDKMFTKGGELYDICTNCHAKYIPPPPADTKK